VINITQSPKDIFIEIQEKDPKNWKTIPCAQCRDNVKVFKPKHKSVYYCDDCNRKLFGED